MAGFEVPAGGAAQIVFLVDVTTPGDRLWPGVDIEYSYRGSTFFVLLRNGFAVCTSELQECPASTENADDQGLRGGPRVPSATMTTTWAAPASR